MSEEEFMDKVLLYCENCIKFKTKFKIICTETCKNFLLENYLKKEVNRAWLLRIG